MGGAVSSGENNDELVDNLMDAQYIKTPLVEKIFRTVDRAFYYTKSNRQSPYKDLAWKQGNLHLSAPCIYSEVLENLELREGLSFLNIGSGTGYLSTMVGLVLGKWGINHGIELHPDVVEYARFKLEKFKKSSYAVDMFELCEPSFVVGNALDALPCPFRYDRIYCGAACSRVHLPLITDTLKIGGLAVVPVNDSLLQIRRISETKFEENVLLSVSFASLVESKSQAPHSVSLPEWNPLKLTEICRAVIRGRIRQQCKPAVTDQNSSRPCSKPKKRNSRIAGTCTFTRLNGIGEIPPGAGIVSITFRTPEEERIASRGTNETERVMDQSGPSADRNGTSNDNQERPSTSRRYERPHNSENDSSDGETAAPCSSDEDAARCTASRLRSKNCCGRKRSIQQAREQAQVSSALKDAERLVLLRRSRDSSSDHHGDDNPGTRKTVHFKGGGETEKEKVEEDMEEEEKFSTPRLNSSEDEEQHAEKPEEGHHSDVTEEEEDDDSKKKYRTKDKSPSNLESTTKNVASDSSQDTEMSRSTPEERKKRAASSTTDESAEFEYSSDEDERESDRSREMGRRERRHLHPVARMFRLNVPVDMDNSDSADSLAEPEPRLRVMHVGPVPAQPSSPSSSTDLSEEYVDEPLSEINHPLTVAMRNKILQLPLPMVLKSYLNYDRSL